jgi:hypothetical protein
MHGGMVLNSKPQEFYFPEDHPSMPSWFKDIEVIIQECGLWPKEGDLLAQCLGFRCLPGRADCGCRHILFLQPDFVSQKSQLQSWSSLAAICVTFTQNIIVNSILLNNIGGQQNSVSVW